MVSSRVIYTENLSIGFHGGDGTISASFTPQPLTLNRTYSTKATTVQYVTEYQMNRERHRERERERERWHGVDGDYGVIKT
jgi:hypothetical protein